MAREETTTAQAELGPESRDRQARMRSMIDAAVSLFSEEGYDAVSTRRVAERAQCSETLLFRYFGGKRGLLLAICGDLKEPGRFPKKAMAQDFNDPREFVEHYMLRAFDGYRRNGPVLKIVMAAVVNDAELTADFETRHDMEVAYLVEQLRHFRDAGLIASHVELHAIAAAVEQMVVSVGFLMQLLYEKPQDELVSVAQSVALALTRGMRPEGPSALLERRQDEALSAALHASTEVERVIDLLNSVAVSGTG